MFDITGKIINWTGHRLQDMPCKFDRFDPWKLRKLKLIESHLKKNTPKIVISGMAIGVDMWGASIAIKLGIPLHAYVPFVGQEKLWSSDHQRQYHAFLAKSERVNIVCEGGYSAWKMQKRNQAMLDNSEAVLTLYNPEKRSGGTFNCLAAASSMNLPIINFWGDQPEDFSLLK